MADTAGDLELNRGTQPTNELFAKLPNLLTNLHDLSDHTQTSIFTSNMLDIYTRVFKSGDYNFRAATVPLPSRLNTVN